MRQSVLGLCSSTQRDALRRGTRALARSAFYEAHEHFEEAFRSAAPPLRVALSALVQIAASHHQLSLGRGRAAVRTWHKARAKLASLGMIWPEFCARMDALHARVGLGPEGPRFIDPPDLGALEDVPIPDLDDLSLGGAAGFPTSEDRTAEVATGSKAEAPEPSRGARGDALWHPQERPKERPGMTTESTENPATHPETYPGGLAKLLGLAILSASDREVVGELTVRPDHHQPMGIVHGGVYCAMVETVCSVGGFMSASKRGDTVVGVDNQTSFLKATRTGKLRVVARPLSTGRRTQLWEAHIHNDEGVLVSTGRVRLIAVEASAQLAGRAAGDVSRTPR